MNTSLTLPIVDCRRCPQMVTFDWLDVQYIPWHGGRDAELLYCFSLSWIIQSSGD